MVFEGAQEVFERIYRFNSKKGELQVDLKNFFGLRSDLSKDNIISA